MKVKEIVNHFLQYITLFKAKGISLGNYTELKTISILDFYYEANDDILQESRKLAINRGLTDSTKEIFNAD